MKEGTERKGKQPLEGLLAGPRRLGTIGVKLSVAFIASSLGNKAARPIEERDLGEELPSSTDTVPSMRERGGRAAVGGREGVSGPSVERPGLRQAFSL